jgi:DNA polymerase elongation subunit (family B)
MLHREFFNFVKTMCNFTNLKIVRKKYQKLTKTPILKEYVNGLMESKNDAKQNGDTSLQQGIKYLLNTPYGKMGQKPFEEDYILNEYNQIEKKDKDVNSIKYRMVNTASFIVQNARLHLLSVIKKIIDDGGKFLYCDTDSLTMVVDKNVDMNKYMEIDDYKLGA